MSTNSTGVGTDAKDRAVQEPPTGPAVPAPRGPYESRSDDDHASWQERSRIVFTPIAAPSILGLMGFAVATFMVASLLAGWWGSPATSSLVLAPFAFFFGGLAQLLAAMWSYRARDGVATTMHGTWGAFWLAWGWLVGLVNVGVLPAVVLESRAFGFWFIGLTVVTLFGALASLGDNLALATVLWLLTAGSALLAAGFVGGIGVLVTAGGWVLVASAAAAFYTAGAMMLAQSANGRVVLPLGEKGAQGNIPGRRAMEPIGYDGGMPGAKVGQ
jgi:succinate-acetate transporter protein